VSRGSANYRACVGGSSGAATERKRKIKIKIMKMIKSKRKSRSRNRSRTYSGILSEDISAGQQVHGRFQRPWDFVAKIFLAA
jgi:hypothetical protein